ncbi:MAG: glutaredoxin family protein [Halapricum sp.]
MPQTTITIYTRENCHLCDAAIETCERAGESVPADVTLDLVDVDEDPELRETYGDRVPYVLVDGHPTFNYRVDEAELRQKLTA